MTIEQQFAFLRETLHVAINNHFAALLRGQKISITRSHAQLKRHRRRHQLIGIV